MPSLYVFLIRFDDPADTLAYQSVDPEPLEDLQRLARADLHETDTAGVWGTLDGHTTVERREWVPVGTFPEDHGKVGDRLPAVAR